MGKVPEPKCVFVDELPSVLGKDAYPDKPVDFDQFPVIGERRVGECGVESARSSVIDPVPVGDASAPKVVDPKIGVSLSFRLPEHRNLDSRNRHIAEFVEEITAGKRFTRKIGPTAASVEFYWDLSGEFHNALHYR